MKLANRLISKWLQPSPAALARIELMIADNTRKQNSLRTAIASALAYCATAGLQCDFIFQPMVFDLRVPARSDREIQITTAHVFPRFDTLARIMYAQASVVVPTGHMHDFRDTFDRSTNPIFLDQVHTNELGYRLIAERIASRIPIAGHSSQSDVPQPVSTGVEKIKDSARLRLALRVIFAAMH